MVKSKQPPGPPMNARQHTRCPSANFSANEGPLNAVTT